MAGTAAESILIICSQLHVMNQFSHCHKKTQMKPRWSYSDARNGVTAWHCEAAGSEPNLPKGSWIHWTSLMDVHWTLRMGFFKVWTLNKQTNHKTHLSPNS